MKENISLDIKTKNREAKLTLVSRNGNLITVLLDEKEYVVDLIMVERGVYSVLHEGNSYNIELFESDSAKKYMVNTYLNSFDVEIIDAESKYQQSRKNSSMDEENNIISSPMPGKVVKIPVKVGDKVGLEDIVIIVSAMKMESNYKATKEGIIKEILVKEGDTITSNQELIIID